MIKKSTETANIVDSAVVNSTRASSPHKPHYDQLTGEALDSTALLLPWVNHYIFAYAPVANRCALVSQTQSGFYGRLAEQAGSQKVSLLRVGESNELSITDPHGHPIRRARISKFDLIVSVDLASGVPDLTKRFSSISDLLVLGGRAIIGAAINLGVPFWSEVSPERVARQSKWLEPFSAPVRFGREFLRGGLPDLSTLQRGTIVLSDSATKMAQLVTSPIVLPRGQECWRVLPKNQIVASFFHDHQDYLDAFTQSGLRVDCEHCDVMSLDDRASLNKERASHGGSQFGVAYEHTPPFAVWELVKTKRSS